ncbi:hypothetical protein [Flavicella sediminum]|uniref:hypothetical protein n=1 Tax=Flavicella sediminum TaxID=2585141 RepID=UPI00111F9BFF|nr:hypothetical protein [Flavicella sediminum]
MKKAAVFIFSLLLFISCTENEIFQLDKEFSLQLKESALISTNTNNSENLKIEFHELLEYSVCPENVNCIWAGRAIVNLKINDSEILQLALLDNDIPSKKMQDGYEITLVDVTFIKTNSTENSYSVHLIIKKTTP